MHLENNMDVFCLDKKDKISLYSSIPRKKGLTDICEAFWQWKRTYHRAGIPPCPSFCSWPLCSLFSIFQCTEAKQPPSIPSLLLHGWAPAGFLRGFCRLAVSIGIVMEKGRAYQPGESLCQESIFILLVYGQRGQGRGDPGALGESF